MDFTLEIFKELLTHFEGKDCTLKSYLMEESNSNIILRHDVDKNISSALRIANIEAERGIKATYYFRVPKTFNTSIINNIYNFNHEIGYHYEVLSKSKGNYKEAIKLFEEELRLFERWGLKTICMHGSPLSSCDNRLLWTKFNYRDFGIIGEPYFDIDFNEVLYLTDTGRKWNSEKANIKDKVASIFDYQFNSTKDIISALKTNMLPDLILLNIHPHRWNDSFLLWGKELVWQNIKNIGKILLNAKNSF